MHVMGELFAPDFHPEPQVNRQGNASRLPLPLLG
jgi:hypothetical protein